MGDHPSKADLRKQGRPVEWRSKAGAARDWSHAHPDVRRGSMAKPYFLTGRSKVTFFIAALAL